MLNPSNRGVFSIVILLICFFTFRAEAQTWEDFAGGFDDNENDSLYLDPEDSLDIAEIVFRHLFEHNTAVKRRKSKFYIVSWFHAAQHRYIDPNPPFMARFYDIRPRVKRTSFYYEKQKKLEGEVIFFFITSIYMKPDGSVWVHGGYYQSENACAGHRYQIIDDRGAWIIKQAVLEWTL